MTPSFTVRDMLSTEADYIATSWKRSILSADWRIRHSLSVSQAWALLNEAVDRHALPTAYVRVGVLPDDPETIITWAATDHSGQRLLFAFTKPRFRKMGIQTRLLATFTPAPVWRGFDPFLALENNS